MRYVTIADNASVEDIDQALDTLRIKLHATSLDVSKRWIGEDIDTLLDLRNIQATVRPYALGSQPSV